MGSLNSTLRFDGATDVGIEMQTASLSASRRLDQKWTIRGGVGLILDGELSPETGLAQKVNPGGLMVLGLEYLARIGAGGYSPTVDYSIYLSGSASETEDPLSQATTPYRSADLRLAARASWSFKDQIFPSVSGRVFGGPVNWSLAGQDVQGTDIYHYQLALGTAVQFSPVAVFFEYSFLGERAVSVGLSYTR